MATIYAVVRIDTPFDGIESFHIYTKQTSNLEVMKAYRAEQAARHQNSKVQIMEKKEAYALKSAIYRKMKEREKANLAKLEDRTEMLKRWKNSKFSMERYSYSSSCGCSSMKGAMEAYEEYKNYEMC